MGLPLFLTPPEPSEECAPSPPGLIDGRQNEAGRAFTSIRARRLATYSAQSQSQPLARGSASIPPPRPNRNDLDLLSPYTIRDSTPMLGLEDPFSSYSSDMRGLAQNNPFSHNEPPRGRSSINYPLSQHNSFDGEPRTPNLSLLGFDYYSSEPQSTIQTSSSAPPPRPRRNGVYLDRNGLRGHDINSLSDLESIHVSALRPTLNNPSTQYQHESNRQDSLNHIPPSSPLAEISLNTRLLSSTTLLHTEPESDVLENSERLVVDFDVMLGEEYSEELPPQQANETLF